MIKIVAVGKLKEKALISLFDEYKKRLKPYTKIELIEVNDEQTLDTNSFAQNEIIKNKEGERILSKIKESEYVVLLDLWGEMINSETFAKKLEDIYTYHSSNITFVIGGSLGLSKDVVKRANFRWKFSDLTFTHQMIRILLMEQIYRAYKINYHEPYHK